MKLKQRSVSWSLSLTVVSVSWKLNPLLARIFIKAFISIALFVSSVRVSMTHRHKRTHKPYQGSKQSVLRKIMHVDDRVIFAEHWEELQGALEEWDELFKQTWPKDVPRQDRSDAGNRERS